MLLGRLTNDAIAAGAAVHGVELDERDEILEVRLTTAAGERPESTDPALSELYAQAGARRHEPVRVVVEHQPFRSVVARVESIPGYGWAAWAPAPLAPLPVTATEAS